jgi:hypothetical protein
MPNLQVPEAAALERKPRRGAERRSSTRVKRHIRVSWRLLGADEEHNALGDIRDISRSGVALELTGDIRLGSVLTITFEDVPGFADPHLVRVRHLKTRPDGITTAGCSFTRRFSETDFDALLQATDDLANNVDRSGDNSEVSDGSNVRRSKRRASVSWLPIRIKPVNLLRPESIGRLRDLSAGGIGLSSLVSVPVGTILDVRVETPNTVAIKPPWVQVRVQHCRPYERQWILGCRFVDRPAPEMLAQFED